MTKPRAPVTKPAWLPDWKDETAYPLAASTVRIERWRWEFLRRNPDYQQDWSNLNELYQKLLTAQPELGKRYRSDYGRQGALLASSREFRARVGPICNRYGLKAPLDPCVPHSGRVLSANAFHWRQARGILNLKDGRAVNAWNEHGALLVAFDLHGEIEPQLEWARAWFDIEREQRGIRQRSKRGHVSRWPLYLRVIDARTSGATWVEIGATLRLHSAAQRRAGANVAPKAQQTWTAAQSLMFRFSAIC